MATFTITTAVNIDTLTSKAGSDTYNINGGYLTVDQHTRYGTNQNTSAAMGNLTLSATLGGTVEFNSTLVRLIAYNTGTGNVPALGTTISQGSASGILLGVYSALNVAPTAAAAAMPASGYILIRQWNSVAYTTGALTGIGASATAADRAGWLEIVGVDALLQTCNRLGTYKVRGDWFDLGTTDGTRATTYQIPSNGAIVYLPGVEVETGSGTGVYEFYPCAGTKTALLASIATDAVRGRFCWISTAGLLRFGHDGTNSTGGYIPPTGRKIRIPNIFFMTCISTGLTVNSLPHATLATRMEFSTAGGGVVDIDKACFNWYLNLNQPFSVALTNVFICTALVLTECASPIAWSNVGVGQEAGNTQLAFTSSLNFAGGTMDKCTWTRVNQGSSAFTVSWIDCSGFTITNERTHSLTKASVASALSHNLSRVASSTWTGTLVGGASVWMGTCSDIEFNNTTYYDDPALTTGTAIPFYMFQLGSKCMRVLIDGIDFGGLTMVQPYSGILLLTTAGCSDIKLRNLGTAAAPLDMGGAFVNATWTRATTVMTITKTAHGLKTGDIIAVNASSDVAPKAITTAAASLWTVASAPTADTFTVTVTNAGQTTGQYLSYYPCVAGVIVSAAGYVPADVKVQRCYTPHIRASLFTLDNSCKGFLAESCWGSEWSAQSLIALNMTVRNAVSTATLTAQTSVYGSHWIDQYTTGIPANTAAVAWARTTTVARVTSAGHGLRVGDQVLVTVTSDAAAIVLGVKTIVQNTASATPPIPADVFSFTCLNAGAASGTLTFTPLNGRVAILMNEPTTETSSQVSLAGGAAFTSAGGLYMPVINDQATFTYPTLLKGHSSFPIAEPVMAGGTIGNYDITYSLDGGTTYSNLYYPRAGGGGASASTNVTMTSTTGVAVGDYVFGTNIAPNAKVSSITDGTTVVVDIANIGVVSGVLRFNHLPSETVADATVGFSLKVRIKTTTTNATAITSLYFCTNSTTAARAATYPLDTNTVTFTGLPTGTDAVVLDAGTTTILAQQDAGAGTTYVYTYSGAQTIDVGFIKQGYVPLYIRGLSLGTTDSSIPVAMTADRNYV